MWRCCRDDDGAYLGCKISSTTTTIFWSISSPSTLRVCASCRRGQVCATMPFPLTLVATAATFVGAFAKCADASADGCFNCGGFCGVPVQGADRGCSLGSIGWAVYNRDDGGIFCLLLNCSVFGKSTGRPSGAPPAPNNGARHILRAYLWIDDGEWVLVGVGVGVGGWMHA